jgi:hypothetical protein
MGTYVLPATELPRGACALDDGRCRSNDDGDMCAECQRRHDEDAAYYGALYRAERPVREGAYVADMVDGGRLPPGTVAVDPDRWMP